MPDTALRYVAYAPSYNENNGGAIFMHELVHTLNTLGQDAYVHPMGPIRPVALRNRIKRLYAPPTFNRSPDLNTPLATKAHMGPDTVVIYSEITPGNPARAKNVVRWLLYKPGLQHPFDFGQDEMFFRVGEITDIPDITGGAPDLLLWKVNRAYKNENRPDRKGACFIVRKGHEKPHLAQTENAIQIDGMSHAQVNEVFNQCDTFYSYDEATMYSQYAALCGCTSIILPGLYPDREAWSQTHELGRYGVAYGLDDTAHAIATRHKVESLLQAQERNGLDTVERFIELTHARFAPN